jgi:hypothetical protein
MRRLNTLSVRCVVDQIMSSYSTNVGKLIGSNANGIVSLDESRLNIRDTGQDNTPAHTTSAHQTTDNCANGGPLLDDQYDHRVSTEWEDQLSDSDSAVKVTSDLAHDQHDTATDGRECDERDNEEREDGCSMSSWFFCSLNRREKLVLLSVAVVNLTSRMSLSMMAPFFPIEVTESLMRALILRIHCGDFPVYRYL